MVRKGSTAKCIMVKLNIPRIFFLKGEKICSVPPVFKCSFIFLPKSLFLALKPSRCMYTMEYYSAIKRNETELFVVRWMDLESYRVKEVRQRKILYDITYMWNLKIIQMNLHTKQTDLQTQKTNLWLPKGSRRQRGIDQEYGINR